MGQTLHKVYSECPLLEIDHKEKFVTNKIFIHDFADLAILEAMGLEVLESEFAVVEGCLEVYYKSTMLLPFKGVGYPYVLGLLHTINGKPSALDNLYANSGKRFGKEKKFDLTQRKVVPTYPLRWNSRWDLMNGTYQMDGAQRAYAWVFKENPAKVPQKIPHNIHPTIKNLIKNLKEEK